MNAVRCKPLVQIEDMEDYPDYAIDVNGNVWSTKYKNPRILKPGKVHNGYLYVRLTNKYKKIYTHYIHRLVALAFIPTYDNTRGVTHKNKDRNDNRIENIEWVVPNAKRREANDYILQENLIEKIQKVHIAAQKKGLRIPDNYDFTTQMVENAIESYIMQYGLRKVM